MKSYTGFAQVYDTFMDNVPYREWADYLLTLLKEYGLSAQAPASPEGPMAKEAGMPQEGLAQERREVLDLGCGTGTLTEMLSAAGYDMIGVDSSEDMLEIALEKREKSGSSILYLNQDMRELELYGTVGAVISVCDSLNYLLEEKDLVKTFSLVNNYLYPGGVFIFDFNTVYKYAEVIGDATIAEDRDDCSFIWDNYYHEEEQINEYDLTIFVEEKEMQDAAALYRKFSETHYQRGYTLEQMKAFVEKAGLQFVKAIDAETHTEVSGTSERIYVIAKECQKRKETRLS